MHIRDYEKQVAQWCRDCFGNAIAFDTSERNFRFLEEALELVQSLDCTKEDALQLVDYVYGREAGDPGQEVGGVMITLAALTAANLLGLDASAVQELERIQKPEIVDKIRSKHLSKSHPGPLPGNLKA